ncbi:YtxH domain-containing protein [Mycobacterium sp. GA-2829]|uniref:YtxH domain-containing protein n=1 Tax=Mycobacterium sp. GA-2829 TaxID=1772283 RepID=UPI0012F7CF19|nr:YtxH domain-containing protein [Mycobacterium sp. GA-2829]
MSAAWFGLIGVVLGGAISACAALFSAVRQDLNDAVVAARLIDLDLQQRVSGDARSEELWVAHRAALAKALGHRQWLAVAAASSRRTRRPPSASWR